MTAGCGGSGKNEKPDETNDTDDASGVSDEANDTGNETNDTDNETTGDTDNETNDGDTAGECEENATRADCAEGIYSRCNGGRWEKVECPNEASCTTDGTCGECDLKCGECINSSNKNCKEDSQGIGSADICVNGTWGQKNCSFIRNINVSCHKFCQPGGEECKDECGQCPNTDFLCVTPSNSYGYEAPFLEQLCSCENGEIVFIKECQQNTCEASTAKCAAAN